MQFASVQLHDIIHKRLWAYNHRHYIYLMYDIPDTHSIFFKVLMCCFGASYVVICVTCKLTVHTRTHTHVHTTGPRGTRVYYSSPAWIYPYSATHLAKTTLFLQALQISLHCEISSPFLFIHSSLNFHSFMYPSSSPPRLSCCA